MTQRQLLILYAGIGLGGAFFFLAAHQGHAPKARMYFRLAVVATCVLAALSTWLM